MVNVECVQGTGWEGKRGEEGMDTVGTQKWWNTETKVRTREPPSGSVPTYLYVYYSGSYEQ
jgi:hypothetical protein